MRFELPRRGSSRRRIGDGLRTLRGAWNQLGRPSLVAEELLKTGLPTQLDPVVHVPDVGQRLLRSQGALLVRRRTVLADHRRVFHTTVLLRLPDPVPPPLVPLHVGQPLGRARIAHLRAVVVADAAVRVDHLRQQHIDGIVQNGIRRVGLRDVDPVREVGADLDFRVDIRVLEEEVARHIWGVQEAFAVRLVGHGEPHIIFPSECLLEPICRHGRGEVIA
mmetsp:Transcript_55764/g.148709  ORF Transcript_55764/g.148709 Transcript_55764/m.148709 type:complete len:220 (+) Transcript_55764:195-854(+)